jgi:Uncharacterized conserved protein (DUF2190)
MSFENSGPIVQQPSSSDLSFVAGTGGVTAGQLVYVSANGTVLPTSGIQNFVGVVKVGAAEGKICTVTCGKAKVRVISSGTINAGDKVVSAASGKAQSLAAVTAASIETTGAEDDTKVAAAINNQSSRTALCDTGATDGNQAVIII